MDGTFEHLAQSLARRDWALAYQLGHVVAALARQAFQDLGYGRFDAYLREVLDLSSSAARRLTELAAGLDTYLRLRQSFEAGRLCPAKIELLVPVLKKRPEEEALRVEQAERLGVRALRRALAADLEDEPELIYVSFEMTGSQVLSWRRARETACKHLEAEVPRAEALEYAVAEFLSGEERLAYEEVLMPPRPEPGVEGHPASILRVELVAPELPRAPIELQGLALMLLEERKRVALRQGQVLLELVCQWCRRSPVGRFSRDCLGLSRSTAYKRMSLAAGCGRHPGLEQLSPERALLLLPLLDRGVSNTWMEFAAEVTLQDLERWVRHVKWQQTFCFAEFCTWCWRAPNPGERPPEGRGGSLLPTLVQHPLDCALAMAARGAVQVLEARQARVGFDQLLAPVQVSDSPRCRVGWMVPRDFYPVLLEGVDLAGESLFSDPGASLARVFDLFVKAYGEGKPRDSRTRIRRRDGHCCQAPGCTGRGKLHVHHVVFRSRGGCNESWNLVLVCSACHRLIHLGLLGVRGRAPHDLVWTRPHERWERGRRVKIPGQGRGVARIDRAAA